MGCPRAGERSGRGGGLFGRMIAGDKEEKRRADVGLLCFNGG